MSRTRKFHDSAAISLRKYCVEPPMSASGCTSEWYGFTFARPLDVVHVVWSVTVTPSAALTAA